MSRTMAGVTLLLLAVVFVGGCGGSQEKKAAVPARSYEMRGIVRQISPPEAEGRQIWIHHEALTDFTDIRGNSVPMDAMSMPFHLSETVDLGEVDPGDKVSFRLDVDWSTSLPARIGRLETLPVDTQLSFEKSDTEESAEHGDSH